MAGYKKNMAQYENLTGWEKLSLGKQLDKWAVQYGDRIAVADREKEITYLELNQKAICIGQYFMEKGICKGDKVLVQLPNRISFVAILFALAKIGAVPIMMLPAHREAELEGIIELAKPTAYIVVERYLGFAYVEMAMAMQKKFPCIRNVFVDGAQREEWYEAEMEGQGEFPNVDSYSPAVLLLSGGTTGIPKLIPRTHTDYMYNEEYRKLGINQKLRLILMSGDWIPVALPDRVRGILRTVKMEALGGATEASIWSNCYEIPDVIPENWKSIPYGKPLANQKYYILDQNMENCPNWVPGNLYIAGEGIALGYLNDEEKTKEKFIIWEKTGEKLYSTGDMGRYWSDGNIEFLGRVDNQIKINGYRVEIGEIENALYATSLVKKCMVSYEKDKLCAYIIKETESINVMDLQEQLSKILAIPIK